VPLRACLSAWSDDEDDDYHYVNEVEHDVGDHGGQHAPSAERDVDERQNREDPGRSQPQGPHVVKRERTAWASGAVRPSRTGIRGSRYPRK
jgi:hypothetical protein